MKGKPKNKSLPQRITNAYLIELNRDSLLDRDRQMLNLLFHCKYATTDQFSRLYFTDSINLIAASRATSRALKRLKKYGLIESFPRRMSGPGHGSSAYIWYLSEAGYKLLLLEDDSKNRKRVVLPSYQFVKHTVAITETYVQLILISRDDPSVEICKVEFEPKCWRQYSNGKSDLSLRPDIFAVTKKSDYEYRWFIEMDLATEDIDAIIGKCDRYIEYYKTGIENEKHGVFPIVIWLVPTEKRKDLIIKNLKLHYPEMNKLFVTVTPEEFPLLIRDRFQ